MSPAALAGVTVVSRSPWKTISGRGRAGGRQAVTGLFHRRERGGHVAGGGIGQPGVHAGGGEKIG